jgi:hypothetical protein
MKAKRVITLLGGVRCLNPQVQTRGTSWLPPGKAHKKPGKLIQAK